MDVNSVMNMHMPIMRNNYNHSVHVQTVPSLMSNMQYKNWMDVNMLVLLSGKTRSEQQWTALFDTAGFKFVKAVPTRGALVITEAVPV